MLNQARAESRGSYGVHFCAREIDLGSLSRKGRAMRGAYRNNSPTAALDFGVAASGLECKVGTIHSHYLDRLRQREQKKSGQILRMVRIDRVVIVIGYKYVYQRSRVFILKLGCSTSACSLRSGDLGIQMTFQNLLGVVLYATST